MTQHEDTLLGVTQTNSGIERTYSAYRIEYDSDTALTELLTDDTEPLSEYLGSGAVQDKVGADGEYTDANGDTQYFTRRLIVEDAVTRDDVQFELDDNDIAYETTDISPTAKQKYLIERENATNASEVGDALELKDSLIDRNLIDEQTRETVATEIQAIKSDDQSLGESLDTIFEVLTGQTASEVLDN